MTPTDEELELINKMIVRPYLLGQAINGILAGSTRNMTGTEVALLAVSVVNKTIEQETKRAK